jgi:DNA-binding winged helix-turn-helix (wHTH) protein/tetratricopeptide (TPR) repeat protein
MVARFGAFEVNFQSGELRRNGVKVRLADQPLQILQLLLERPGEIVTREQLRARLWTSGTFVDFERGLNSAVRKLREALDDAAVNPRFIQTVPRRGYRFIAPVESVITHLPEESAVAAADSEHPSPVRSWIVAAAILMTVAAGLIVQARGGLMVNRRTFPTAGRTLAARTVDPHARELYTKGMLAAGAQTYVGFRDAVAYFEQAIARQPDFADAYAVLAQSQYQFLFGGPLSPREVIPKAEAAAKKAIELDETLPRAHQTLGEILNVYYWKWDEGEREFRRARELSGGAADLTMMIVPALIRTGRLTEALAEAERLREVDPRSFNAHVNVAVARRASGQFDKALSELRQMTEIFPGRARANFQIGVTLLLMGRPHDAIAELESAIAASPTANSRFQGYLGYAYAAVGRTHDARRILDALETRRRTEYVSSFGLALIYDALGDKAAALDAFERAYQERAVEFAQIEQYPAFATISSESRYIERMRSIGLLH